MSGTTVLFITVGIACAVVGGGLVAVVIGAARRERERVARREIHGRVRDGLGPGEET